MLNMDFKVLGSTKLPIIHQAFLKAFSDYQVQVDLSLSDFQIMMKRRGFAPEISLGAFSNSAHEPIGFILNGLRPWDGKLTAYDTGTGVIPVYRKQGITSGLFEQVLKVLARQNVEQYLLEVLQDNTAAFKLYYNQGFRVTRTFSVYQLNKITNPLNLTANDLELIPQIASEDWKALEAFWDFKPSWQNSVRSIHAVAEEFTCAVLRRNTKLIGYGIVGKATGDVPQLAVCQEYRRQGIATQILAALMQNTKSNILSFINVDDTSQSTRAFLERMGSENVGGQYEMVLTLS
ncbi:GNAT family N-acetyltransferase [Aminipila butyrica]|nr:GNAT family N-acetyltransferase [Aminipila butyrica]